MSGMGGGMGDDIFSHLFGGGGGRSQRSGPKKGKNMEHILKVSLYDFVHFT